jgi:Membrane proteins related to metalloendopeptidases
LQKVDDYVYPGDIVGLAGSTGKSSSAHLHFEIRYGEVNIDPATVIDFPHWSLKKGVEKFSIKSHHRPPEHSEQTQEIQLLRGQERRYPRGYRQLVQYFR